MEASRDFNEYGDTELIALWHNGDKRAFEFIYKKYSVKLLLIALQKTGDRETAEEIVQDIFFSCFLNKNSVKNVTSLMPYLYVILKNKILDKYRHSLQYKKYESYKTTSLGEENPSIISVIEAKELERLLNNEIEKLPPQCRTVFKLSRKKFLSNKEIATTLQISENTVEQHIRKALRILRTYFLNYKKNLS